VYLITVGVSVSHQDKLYIFQITSNLLSVARILNTHLQQRSVVLVLSALKRRK